MSFEKFLTNMQTMFTGLSENGEILNDSQKIRLLFQKVQNPIMTQIKASLQVSYDLDQSNKVTYDFISNSLAAEAASLGDHNPQEVVDVNTCGKKSPERGVKGAGGAIFTGFYPNWSKLSDGEKNIYLTRGSDSTSRVEVSASPSTRKHSRAVSFKSKKQSGSVEPNARSHH